MDSFAIFFASSSCECGRWSFGTTGCDVANTTRLAALEMASARLNEFQGRKWVMRVTITVVRASTGSVEHSINWSRDSEAR